MTNSTEAQSSVQNYCLQKHVWCLPRELAVLRTARACDRRAGCHVAGSSVCIAALRWGQYAFCPSFAVGRELDAWLYYSAFEHRDVVLFSLNIQSIVSLRTSETEIWRVRSCSICNLQMCWKGTPGMYCWTHLENRLVCGLHVPQKQEVLIMHVREPYFNFSRSISGKIEMAEMMDITIHPHGLSVTRIL